MSASAAHSRMQCLSRLALVIVRAHLAWRDVVLGELIGETATRYIYRNRAGTCFVSKNSPSILCCLDQLGQLFPRIEHAGFQRA